MSRDSSASGEIVTVYAIFKTFFFFFFTANIKTLMIIPYGGSEVGSVWWSLGMGKDL